MLPTLKNIANTFGVAGRRFPLVILVAIGAFGASLTLNHFEMDAAIKERFVPIYAALLAALPLAVGVGFLAETRRQWLGWGILLFLLWSIGVWFLFPQEEAFFNFPTTYFAALVGAAALASAVPGLQGNKTWWRMNVGLIQAAILSAVICFVVGVGGILAFESIRSLFDLETSTAQTDFLTFTICLVAPFSVIHFIPKVDGDAEVRWSSLFWESLCKWVLVPLGVVFAGILLIYSLSLIPNNGLPDGMVALPVLSLGAYGTAVMLLMVPWREEKTWARWFGRIYPVVYLAFSILLFMALYARIEAYGVTFSRYFGVTAGTWFLISAVILFFKEGRGALWVNCALALMTAIAVWGPVSAGTISLQSQTARLKELLKYRTPGEDDAQIKDGISFLARHFGTAAVENVTGPLDPSEDGKITRQNVILAALKKLDISDVKPGTLEIKLQDGHPISLDGFRYLYLDPDTKGTYWDAEIGRSQTGQKIALHVGFDWARICLDDEEKIDLSQEILNAAKQTGKSGEIQINAPLHIPFEIEEHQYILLITAISVMTDEVGDGRFSNLKGVVLEK